MQYLKLKCSAQEPKIHQEVTRITLVVGQVPKAATRRKAEIIAKLEKKGCFVFGLILVEIFDR